MTLPQYLQTRGINVKWFIYLHIGCIPAQVTRYDVIHMSIEANLALIFDYVTLQAFQRVLSKSTSELLVLFLLITFMSPTHIMFYFYSIFARKLLCLAVSST